MLEWTAKVLRATPLDEGRGSGVEHARRLEAVRAGQTKSPRVESMGIDVPPGSKREHSSWNLAAMELARQSCSTERRVSWRVGAWRTSFRTTFT